MQGTEKPDRELLDALGLCGALVREGSVYRFLAEHRLRLFGDGLFADLFGGRGRPSVPGSVIAVVMVLQALEGCSDREAVERLRCDVRWKAAAGLGIDDEGFDASVLTLWRQRLRASSCPERIFDAVREVAAECGALSKRTMRALDSTVLYDAVATQDTVTMIGAQIRRVRKLAPRAAALVLARDYDGRAKPVCDWGDPDERGWLIDELVSDARAVLDALEGSELTEEQAQAAALLAVVAGQDVEADPKVPGRWRIARRVAKGRVISTVDPEARHARKSRSQRRDGYKAHICAEPDTGLITAAELTTADTSDAQVGPRLLQQDPTAPHNTTDTTDTDTGSDTADTADTTDTDTGSDTADTADTTDTDTGSDTADTADTTDTDTGSDTADTADTDSADTAAVGDVGAEGFVGLVLADSAYASGEALDAFAAAGYGTAIKPIDPQAAHRRRLHPRRLHHRHRRADRDLPRRAHQSHQIRRGPLRRAVRRLPPTRPLHHLRRRAQRHRRRIPPPPTSQQDPLGPARHPGRLPTAPPHGRTLHRMAHPQQSQTRPLPRRRRQPPLAHHQSRRRQPRAPHQPRRHPQQRRLHPLKRPRRAARPNPTGPTGQPATPTPAPSPAATPLAQQSPRSSVGPNCSSGRLSNSSSGSSSSSSSA